jgi:hypothetical protein
MELIAYFAPGAKLRKVDQGHFVDNPEQPGGLAEIRHDFPTFLRDGRHFVYLRRRLERSGSGIKNLFNNTVDPTISSFL